MTVIIPPTFEVRWNCITFCSYYSVVRSSYFRFAVRVANNVVCQIEAHTEEVCGLKWSERGNMLASGGNENHIYIWESTKMGSSKFLYHFKDHRAAVKALAWCPFQSEVLASGGGTNDGRIKLWNTQKGTCINSIETKAQASYAICSPFRLYSY